MIHGLQNNKADAVNKFQIAKKRLNLLGYKQPVIGFSYDANTKGAHLKKTEIHALRVGQKIAKKNGKNLAKFIEDFKKESTDTKIRVLGHSLGSQVILNAVQILERKKSNINILEAIYFFGASILETDLKKNEKKLCKVVKGKIINFFSPTDEVLKHSDDTRYLANPLGLYGVRGRTVPKFKQKRLNPKNHRFASYAARLTFFP